jgi:hypothetical protein
MQIFQPGIQGLIEPGLKKLQTPIVYFDDFLEGGFEDASAKFSIAADVGTWLVTVVEAGSGSQAIVVDDEVGGVLKFTTAANDNDGVNCQMNGEMFLPAAGKATVIEARVKHDSLTANWFVGLCDTDTAAEAAPSEYIGFGNTDEDADIIASNGLGASGGTSSSSTAQTLGTHTDTGVDTVADAWNVVRVEMDGVSSAKFYVDGVLKATHTTNLPNVEMTPTIVFRNEAAGAQNFYIDYLYVAQER